MKKTKKRKPYWKALPEATPEQAAAQRNRLIAAGIVKPAGGQDGEVQDVSRRSVEV